MIRVYATQMLLVAGAMTVIVVERHVALGAAGLARDHGSRPSARHRGSRCRSARCRRRPPPPQTAAALARIPEARLRKRWIATEGVLFLARALQARVRLLQFHLRA